MSQTVRRNLAAESPRPDTGWLLLWSHTSSPRRVGWHICNDLRVGYRRSTLLDSQLYASDLRAHGLTKRHTKSNGVIE